MRSVTILISVRTRRDHKDSFLHTIFLWSHLVLVRINTIFEGITCTNHPNESNWLGLHSGGRPLFVAVRNVRIVRIVSGLVGIEIWIENGLVASRIHSASEFLPLVPAFLVLLLAQHRVQTDLLLNQQIISGSVRTLKIIIGVEVQILFV